MNLFRKIAAAWRSFFRKRRVAWLNAQTREEEGHIHLSPAGSVAACVSLLLLLFITVLMLVAYTPVLEFLPGYRTEATRSRESLIQQVFRLDSMERVMNDMLTYNRNIAMIMAGKTPVARTIVSSDSTRTSKIFVMPSAEDSLLRAQMEGDGPYSLERSAAATRRSLREAIELITPVEGVVSEHFNIEEGRFGVCITSASANRVTAIDNGTVISSIWSPDEGYQLTIQHRGNLVAHYKHLSQPSVVVGQAVRAGELVGYTATYAEGETPKPFEFELWNNGKAVDPEGFILF